MRKIDKLFIKSFIGPFALTTAIVVFIFLMRFLMMYFNEFIGKDLGIDVFSKLFFFFSMITVPTALPLATLLATLMCFGNLGEHTELTAMKSAGIPLSRLILPTFILSLIVSIVSYFYNDRVNPWANLKGYSLLYDIKTTKMTLNIQEGIFYKEIPGYRIKVQKKFPDGKTLKNIIVYNHSSNLGNKNITIADSGKMYTMYNGNYLIFELFNGYNYTESQNSFNNYDETQFTKTRFKKNKVVFSLESFGIKRTNEDQFKYHEYMKNVSELTAKIDSSKIDIKKTIKQQTDQIKSQNTYLFKKTLPSDSAKKVIIKPGPWIKKELQKLESGNRKEESDEYALSQVRNLKNQLETDLAIISNKSKEMYRADVERWHKFTMAFSCLVFFIVGASLGSIIKKGGFGMPVLLSISIFIFYYVLMQLGDKYAKEGIIPVVVGVWIPDFVLSLIGIILLRKASNDARLFENDNYNQYFEKIKKIISKISFDKKNQTEVSS
ncbi:MAG: LptF/LptG family permease [Cytophagaceae bacterium]|nr:LptF/LptG family permease [Cytophagaceae bacterium]MBK9936160.1 LptF/LptG family permease [Cytophagaceae bacterium]MBL0303953.1 LptF/LptG family permease [Cytophagaceae bacterium]MBL0326767.1 LptF/LptG family permease [Cytophagaceae bacterium]